MSNKASPATTPTDVDPPEDPPSPMASSFSSSSSSPLPCWATQALCDLAKSETDMRRLRERQSIETESVSRGLERAVMGVHREERRLLERVEQDQRDAQQRLEQLRRENAAAVRVAQALLDQRLKKVGQLRLQVQQTGSEAMRSSESYELNQRRDDLLKNVAELLQPWEISLSLKRVCFKPSSQAKPISFGEIKIQDHNLSFPVGGCGAKGQLCALHSSGGQYGEQGVCTHDGRSTPEGAGGSGQGGQGQGQGSSSGNGNLRVVRKLRLSRSDEESGEDFKRTSSRSQRWPPKRDSSERDSSQDEEQESPTSDLLFLAVPNLVGNGDSEGEDSGSIRAGKTHRHGLRDKRGHLPHRDASPFLEPGSVEQEGWYFRSFESGDSKRDRGKVGRQSSSPRALSRFGYGTVPSPRGSSRDSLSSHSCMDLSSRDRPRSRLSVCSDDHPHHGSYGEAPPGGRPSSPTDSVDSGYTFIISSPRDYAAGSSRRDSRLSKSTVDLSQRNRPLINGSQQGDTAGLWKVHRSRYSSTSTSPPLGRGMRRTVGRAFSCTATKEPGLHSQHHKGQRVRSSVSRSLSLSVIDGSSQDGFQASTGGSSQSKDRGWEGMNEPALVEELEEEGEPVMHGEGRLLRQFGKQGSGRADLTLPSGVHCTLQGQLFLVDCGNARVQVVDSVGNVMQQVKSPGAHSASRRCRNYFDVAVNSKGLIALSCAAERALLVFSRHGRLLQTYGGYAGPGAPAASADGLEAPRGVTVTRQDEFLVADIRKGTLTAMKLEPKTGLRLERTVVTGFHRPYLVAASPYTDLTAVSERGSETGREPCVKVLDSSWNTIRVLGVCSGMGPVLACPWGICIDGDGAVLVADWAGQHRVVLYPAQGVGRTVVSRGLSSPRGLALLPDGSLVVSDSMHHCVKIYQYK